MHHALVLSIFSSTFLILTTLSGTTGDPGPNTLPEDGSLLQAQAQQKSGLIPEEIEEEKRSWKDLQNGWGKRGWKDRHLDVWEKRGWKDLQGTGWGKRSWGDLRNGWGKRDLQNSWDKRAWSDLKGGSWGKRDWNQFRGGWGKRDRHSMDDQMENLYDYPENTDDEEDDMDEDLIEDDKRAWSNLKGQWGKRDWSSFKGSWGKRDPAWHNLKGLWGKRSVDSKWAKLQGGWGKRSIGVTHEGERMSTEIPLWVNGKIRWLSGIDKKTTCKDVVEALLEEEGVNKTEAKDFTIMERWRKVERQLDENSKILKIWSHWGNEKKEVRLCLRRIDNEVDSGRGSPESSGYLPSLRRKRNRIRGHGKHPWTYRETLHPRRLAELGRFDKKEYEDYPHVKTKQNELIDDNEALIETNNDIKISCDKGSNDRIREAEVINKKVSEYKSYHCSGTGKLHSTPVFNSTESHSKKPKCCSKRESKQKIRNSENIEKLMKLILAQGATIQNQLQKLKEREEQIELLEHEKHRERIEKNGRNYLLEAYLGSLKYAEIPEDPNGIEGDNDTGNAEIRHVWMETNSHRSGKIYGKAHSEYGRDGHDFSSAQQHKGTRSKSESRTRECKPEANLKRTYSDNVLADTSAEEKENKCSSGEDIVQEIAAQNTKEEFAEVVELRKIQSQIEMWEKVFKINKKLEKEEENLVRLHIKIKKVQSENYRVVKDKKANDEKEKDAETVSPDKNSSEDVESDKMQYKHDCAELEKNLETLRSDLEHNSKEIYKNFTKLIEEDEIVEQKRGCLSKIMSDLEKTNHENEMLNEMVAMAQSQNFQNDETRTYSEGPVGFGSEDMRESFGEVQSGTKSESPYEKPCSNAVSLPLAQGNVNQRTEMNGNEILLPVKPKIVKISFEDKIQNYETSECFQYKVPSKDATPVPAGALKSILKNRKNSLNEINSLKNNEYQKYQGLAQNYDCGIPQKNSNINDCYIENYYSHSSDLPNHVNSSQTYVIPYPLYVNYPKVHNNTGQLSKLSENFKSVCLLKHPQPQELTKTPFSHGAIITTKAVVHNDTDSSTSSDTSGLSSMYSSSTNVEDPYAEKNYVLNTLV